MNFEEGIPVENEQDFQITNDSLAEWALKKVLAARKERDRLAALVESEIAALNFKREEIERHCENETAFLVRKLNDYFRTVEHKKTKTQETYQLLSGKLVFKTPKQEFAPDKEKLLDWCKENAPQYVETKQSVMWGELKKQLAINGESVAFVETGELVEGVSVTESSGSFDVKE